MFALKMSGLPIAARWDYRGVLVAGAVLIVLILVGAAGLMLLRRRIRNTRQAASPKAFTLDELRGLHRRGLISDQEYERAKARMVQAVRAEGDSTAPAGQIKADNPQSADGTSSS